jgi:hypothetical protein
LCTPTARKLLVTLRLGFRAITAGDWCATGGFGYYALRWEAFFIVLIAAMDGVVTLQKITMIWSAGYISSARNHKSR